MSSLAFGNKGFIWQTKEDEITVVDLPKELYDQTIGRYTWLMVALGPGRAWFCHGRDKKGKRHYLHDRTEAYVGLRDNLERNSVLKSNPRICLGPDGFYWAMSDTGCSFHLPEGSGVRAELERRVQPPTRFKPDDPLDIALGADDAWVVVGPNGEVIWDLKGNYTVLEKILSETEDPIKQVKLHPSNKKDFFVVFASDKSASVLSSIGKIKLPWD